jgi:hypothetical protein
MLMMGVTGLGNGGEEIVLLGQVCLECAKKPLLSVAHLKHANSTLDLRSIQMF